MRAQSPEPKQTTAHDGSLWTIDLHQFGYERWLRKNTRPFPVGVDFTDNDHIAVAWTMPDIPHEAKGRAPLTPEPAHLNVVIFDANTGQKQNKAEWPTAARYFSKPLFFGIPDGKLLTCSENDLRLLSSALGLVREIQLPSQANCLNVQFQYSPSRRTVLVSILSELSRNEELLDVETLSILSSWTQERTSKEATSKGIISISDHWAMGYCGGASELCLRRSGEDWQPFHPNGFDTHMIKHQRIPSSFVNDNTLVVTRQVAAVATVDGTVLFEITPPQQHMLLPPVTSAGGSHFAMIEDRFRGLRSEPLDMYPFAANDRASVYSIKNRRCIFSIKLKGTSPWTPWDVHDNYLALSPNGTSLAVISDGVLKIYPLPGDSVGGSSCQ
jgi:hypothetical protein